MTDGRMSWPVTLALHHPHFQQPQISSIFLAITNPIHGYLLHLCTSESRARCVFQSIFSILIYWRMKNNLVLRQSMLLTFLLHKQANACQVCTKSVVNSKLKSYLFKDIKNGEFGPMAAPKEPLKQCTCFLGHPVNIMKTCMMYTKKSLKILRNNRGGG